MMAWPDRVAGPGVLIRACIGYPPPVATFAYTALDAQGKRVAGVLAGPSEQAVLAELETRRLTPVTIAEQAAGRARRGGVSKRRLGESYQGLAALLHAGVPMMRGLRLLANRKGDPRVAALFRELADAVEKGADVATAMSERPESFPQVHVAMVRAGERGGFLEDVLARLGRLVLAQAELRSKIVGSLVYPGVLACVFVLVFGVLFGVFVPKFKEMFAEMPGSLPFITTLVFGVGDAVGKHGLWTLIAAVVLGWGVRRLARREDVSLAMAAWSLKVPILGPLLRSMATARLCQLLGAMLGNGVPMLAALQIAVDGAGHPLYAKAVERAAEAVRAGAQLAVPLGQSGLFEDDVIEMIGVGEAANNLDQVLVRVGETIEARMDRQLTIAVRLIEPLMILALGALVGVTAAGLLLPMTRLGGGM